MPPQLRTRCIVKAPTEIRLQKENILEIRLRADLEQSPLLYKIHAEGGLKIEFSADRVSRRRVGLSQLQLSIGSIGGSCPAHQNPSRGPRANPPHDFGPLRGSEDSVPFFRHSDDPLQR